MGFVNHFWGGAPKRSALGAARTDATVRLLEELRVVDLVLPGVVVDKGVVPVVVFPYRVRFEGLARPPIGADHRAGKVLNEHLNYFRHIHVLNCIQDHRTEKSFNFTRSWPGKPLGSARYLNKKRIPFKLPSGPKNKKIPFKLGRSPAVQTDKTVYKTVYSTKTSSNFVIVDAVVILL
jgi:hypothetical protein